MNIGFNTATVARIQKISQRVLTVVVVGLVIAIGIWYGLKLWKQYNIKNPIQTLEILQENTQGQPSTTEEQLSTLQTIQNKSAPVDRSVEEQRAGLEALQNI